jgi:hypothetical protein
MQQRRALGFADLKALLAGPPSPERDEIRAWARPSRRSCATRSTSS